MDMLKELEAWVEECGTAPLYEEMPRKTLADKGAAGPTAAALAGAAERAAHETLCAL